MYILQKTNNKTEFKGPDEMIISFCQIDWSVVLYFVCCSNIEKHIAEDE